MASTFAQNDSIIQVSAVEFTGNGYETMTLRRVTNDALSFVVGSVDFGSTDEILRLSENHEIIMHGNVDMRDTTAQLPKDCILTANIKDKQVTSEKLADNITIGGTITGEFEGDLTGNATSATKLQTARSFIVNLESKEEALFDGTANVTLGVMGVLPKELGGTGNTEGASGNAEFAKTAEIAKKDANGKVIHTTYAPINNANFTGVTTGSTPPINDKSTKFATTAWVYNTPYVVHTFGNETINGEKTFTADIKGTALRAYWADLAENYESDREYPHGTLVQFGGEKEITIAQSEVNGVISRNPAVLMNNESQGLPMALSGRVDVLVIGRVKKFDKLVLSELDGIAKVDNRTKRPIARALESKDSEKIGLVLSATQFRL